MAKYTPMMEQYLEIKAQVPDAFLFFRLGDFYEMFFDDAVLAAKELEITLTGRGGGMEERIPMCGVPYHSAEGYITRLIEKGFKVAICEQVEDPAAAKGVVRREIVRVVTPGTVMEGKAASEAANNFLLALSMTKEEMCGLAACDLTTGELYVTEFVYSREQLIDEVNVYAPSELIGDDAPLDALKEDVAAMPRAVLFTPRIQTDDELMRRQFDDAGLSELGSAGSRAVSLLIAYLNETQKRSLTHIRKIRTYEQQQYMTLDPFTRRNLELTETVRDRAKKGTLLWLLDRTMTSMGSRLLRRWIDKPLMHTAKIEERLEAVDKLYNGLITREEIRGQLKEVYDLERLLGRIAYGSANARDLLALKHSLSQVPELIRICGASGSTTLQGLVQDADDCSDVRDAIDSAIVDEPPVSVRDGGMIKTGYDAYLDQLHEANANGKQWIAELERKEREATGVKSLKIGYNKVFGYYIEVTRANIAALPEGRYERKQTLANAERFVTPELKEKESLILEAQEKMVDLEYELFAKLRSDIAGCIGRLQQLAEMIASVDVLQSFAAVSAANRYCRPDVHEGFDLIVEEGRHPVVEAVMSGGSFVANETRLTDGGGEGRILLITGPNMAGKSTYMRQAALICMMAQIGCFVPADKAKVPVIDRIFTRIGAADDLIGGQSTFMVEMMDIRAMTEKATRRSLVIIDELGRGTSTGEGMSIAQAVIEFLHHRVGCKTLVSTHFHELAYLEESLPELRNCCMAVKESGGDVTFLRKLVRGAASTSYGIYCAKIAGLPNPIIERAYVLLRQFETRAAAEQAFASASSGIEQLELFEIGADASDVRPPRLKNKSASQHAKTPADGSVSEAAEHVAEQPAALSAAPDPKLAELADKLRTMDLLNTTPLQAIQLLHELKQKLQA